MHRPPHRSTRTHSLFPSTTRFRSPRSPANLPVRPRSGAASHPAALRRHPDLRGQPAELAIDQVEIRVAQRRQVVARGQHRLEVELGEDQPLAVAGLRQGIAVGIEHARSEEHTSELQSLMRTSYAVFCLNKNKHYRQTHTKAYD